MGRYGAALLGISLLCVGCGGINAPEPLVNLEEATTVSKGFEKKGRDDLVAMAADVKTLVDVYLVARAQAQADSGDAGKVSVYVDSAFNVLDARCQLYFAAIGKDLRKLEFARQELDLIMAGLSTGLALANVGATTIAAVAASGATASATLSNFGDIYYFSPEIADVETLVNKAGRDARDKLKEDDHRPRTYTDGESAIVSYQSICQPHTIRKMVRAAINASTPIARFGGPERSAEQIFSDALTTRARDKIRTLIGAVVLDDTQIAALYAYFTENLTRDGDITDKATPSWRVCAALAGTSVSNASDDKCVYSQNYKPDTDLAKTVRSALSDIIAPDGDIWNARKLLLMTSGSITPPDNGEEPAIRFSGATDDTAARLRSLTTKTSNYRGSSFDITVY